MDKQEKEILIGKKIVAPSSISCGISWVDGRVVFFKSRHFNKYGNMYYGICSFSSKIWAVTPIDYDIPSMITTILVSPHDNYCEKSFVCLNFSCALNQFDRVMFVQEFKDIGPFSLGLPRDIGTKTLWFNEGNYGKLWAKLGIPIVGGV